MVFQLAVDRHISIIGDRANIGKAARKKGEPATEGQPCVLALADDLTGALETGARFAAAGVPAVVSVELSTASDAPVLVIDTETRHLAPADAAARIHELACQARARGVRFIYKKTDSTLRGNIGAELGALCRADPDSPLVYAPAYPAMGRTVRPGPALRGWRAGERDGFRAGPA